MRPAAVSFLILCVLACTSAPPAAHGDLENPSPDGVFSLDLWADSHELLRVDPLRFSVIMRAADKAPAGSFRPQIHLGGVYLSGQATQSQLIDFTLDFRNVPSGLYALSILPSPGFVRTQSGSVVNNIKMTAPYGRALVYIPPHAATAGGADEHLQRMRSLFEGKTAYVLGKAAAYCDTELSGSQRPLPTVIDDRSISIKRVFRLRGFVRNIAAGSPGLWGADEAFHFSAVDPLIFVFAHPPAHMNGCRVAFFILSDSWQVERFFSPVSLDRAHPEWSAATRSAIRRERVRLGMTHEMVAWARGYPRDYGTPAQLDAQARWDYVLDVKYASWAVFSGDKLVAYRGPGLLTP